MAILPIKPITAPSLSGVAPSAPSGGDAFGQALGSALDKLDAGQQTAAQASQDLATGQATDISSVVNQVEKASLELQLATQIRNKAVEAYQEIFRMQV